MKRFLRTLPFNLKGLPTAYKRPERHPWPPWSMKLPMDAVKPTLGGQRDSYRSAAGVEEKEDRYHPSAAVAVSNVNTKRGGLNEAVDD